MGAVDSGDDRPPTTHRESLKVVFHPSAESRATVGDIGGQLDFRLHMLSTLDLTLSVGGAVAYEHGAAPRREAMVSLKILR